MVWTDKMWRNYQRINRCRYQSNSIWCKDTRF